MLFRLLFLSTFISLNCFAAQPLSLGPIGVGDRVFLNTSIKLPKEHRLNKGAPSSLQIFEKENGVWTSTENLDLNSVFSLTEMIKLQRSVRLRSPNSELKVAMSLYHCPANHKGLCVIDEFESVVKRNQKQASTELQFLVTGTNPKKR